MLVNKETMTVATAQDVINFYRQHGLSLAEETLNELDEFLTACEQPRTESRMITKTVTEMVDVSKMRTITDEDGNEIQEEYTEQEEQSREVESTEEYTVTPELFARPFVAVGVPPKAVYQNYAVTEKKGKYSVSVVHKPEVEILALRKSAYTREADPMRTAADNEALYDGTEPDYTLWLSKVSEIKARYPKEGDND